MKQEYCIVYHKKSGKSKELTIYSKFINPNEEYIFKVDYILNQLVISPLNMDYRGKTYVFCKDGNRFKVGTSINIPQGRFSLDEDSCEDEIIINFSENNLEN